MAEPFLAEVRVVPFNFAPRGWAFCDGQLLPLAQNTALFSLLGTTFGGDGRTTVGLPNIQGRAVLGPGRGPGLSDYRAGQVAGGGTVTLSEAQAAQHTHAPRASPDPAELQAPAPDRALARSGPGFAYQSDTAGALVSMASQTLSSVGSGEAHDNHPPLLTLNFIIALVGLYPQRS